VSAVSRTTAAPTANSARIVGPDKVLFTERSAERQSVRLGARRVVGDRKLSTAGPIWPDRALVMFPNHHTASNTVTPLLRRLLSLLCIVLTSSAASTSIAQSANTPQPQDERSLLTAMVSVKTPQESRILVSSHKKLLTEKLWAMLKEEIDKNFVSEDYPRALFLAEIGKQIAEELQDKRLLTLVLNRIAYIHLMMADYQKAIENGMQCLAAMKGLDNNLVLVNVLLTLGISSIKQGDHTGALEYLQKALTSAGTIADKTYAADALLNLGHVYTNIGDYFKALNHYNQSVAIINTLKDSGRLEDALNELGILYAEQGDYEKAIDYLNQSLKIAKQTDDQRGIASVLITMGIVHREQADLGTAVHKLEEGLKISEEKGFPDLASYARTNCASVYKLQGKYQLALDYYKKSLADAEQARDRQLKAGTLWHLADLHNTTKEHQTALEYANQSIAIATQISLPEISYLALTEKGKAQQALHQLNLAEQSFLRAISTIEELRDHVSGGEPDYQKFLQNRVAPYYCMIDLLVNRNRFAEALAYAERVKARVLLDVLRDGRVHINKSLTQGEEMKERELHNELVSTNTQLRAEKGREVPDVSHVNDLES
jgi:tetratricopeptide (TPR) repeat protein